MTETKEEHHALACSRPRLRYLSHIAQAHLPGNGAAHSGLGPPISTVKQKLFPTDMATGQGDGADSSAEAPLSQVCHMGNQD